MKISDIVAKAGGNDKTAAACGIGVHAVLAWSTRNVLPHKNRATVARLCKVSLDTVERWVASEKPARRNGRTKS